MLKEWGWKKPQYLSIDNSIETLWWTAKSVKNFQIKNLKKKNLLPLITTMNHFVQIQWSKIIKVSVTLNWTPKTNPYQCPKADFKTMMLMNQGFPEIQTKEHVKRRNSKPIKFIWTVQFRSQNKNQIVLWKSREIKSTWDKD